MVCNKWEETGLLFTSGELSAKDAALYREHLSTCQECSFEYTTYQAERDRFFTIDVLGAAPSPECDTEIKRVCSDARTKITAPPKLSLVFRKTAVSVALFLMGFTGVGYLTFKMTQPSTLPETASQVAPTHQQVAEPVYSAKPADSTADTFTENSVNFASKRGNLDLKGVVPVELQNK